MANRSNLRTLLNDNFKILTWVLILFIAITPNFIFINSANASAAEQWEVLQNNYDHLTNKVKLETRKITQDAANSGRYKVQVPVNTSDLGSTVKSMLWLGVAVAGVEAMLNGIGWVIDYATQTIKRPKEYLNPDNPEYCFYNASIGCFMLSDQALSASIEYNNSLLTPSQIDQYGAVRGVKTLSSDNNTLTIHLYNKYNQIVQISTFGYMENPNYVPPQNDTEYEIMTDEQLGSEIIGQGQNSTPLDSAIETAYDPTNNTQNAPAPASSRQALDNANPEPETDPQGETTPKPNVDTDGDGVPDTVDPNAPSAGDTFKLPAFCEWAPSVCDFFTVQKTDNKAIKDNQNKQLEQDKSFIDWFKEMPDTPQTDQLPIEDQTIIFDDSQRINFSDTCPAPEQFTVSFFGYSQNLEFSYQPLCEFMSMIKFFVIAGSYLIGAYIVMGLSRGSAE